MRAQACVPVVAKTRRSRSAATPSPKTRTPRSHLVPRRRPGARAAALGPPGGPPAPRPRTSAAACARGRGQSPSRGIGGAVCFRDAQARPVWQASRVFSEPGPLCLASLAMRPQPPSCLRASGRMADALAGAVGRDGTVIHGRDQRGSGEHDRVRRAARAHVRERRVCAGVREPTRVPSCQRAQGCSGNTHCIVGPCARCDGVSTRLSPDPWCADPS